MKPCKPLIATLLGCALLALAPAGAAAAKAPAKKPNILIIVADDLGYSDLGAFGSEIKTPTLDQLANEGVRLTNFHTAPFCSPTRAMLLSGTDNHRTGFGDFPELMPKELRGKPGYEGVLNQRIVAMPQVLKDAGYRTLMSGKWHLGNNEDINSRGFDRSFALMSGGASHWGDQLGIVAFDPAKPPRADYREDGKSVQIPADFYSSEYFADKTIQYLDEGKASGKPFFAYLAFTAPHWPLAARDEVVAKYADQYDAGYDAIRQARIERLQKLGILAADAPVYAGHPAWPKWDELTPLEKRSEAKRMAVYAAMVDSMDSQIGRVLDYLKKEGELDNTFIFFMSDNGADGNSVYDVERNRDWIEASMDNSIENTGRPGSFILYGPGWGQVSSTPLRQYKSFTYEGGITGAAIAWGPKQGVAQQTSGDGFVHVKDIAPTVYELAGARHPGNEYRGKAVEPVSGTSMLAYLNGTAKFVHPANEAIGTELGGRKALHLGGWKIVYSNPPWGTGKWELYNMALDRAETRNLADSEPAKLAEMVAAWDKYVAENNLILIDGLAARPRYSNALSYYGDLKKEAVETAPKKVSKEVSKEAP